MNRESEKSVAGKMNERIKIEVTKNLLKGGSGNVVKGRGREQITLGSHGVNKRDQIIKISRSNSG